MEPTISLSPPKLSIEDLRNLEKQNTRIVNQIKQQKIEKEASINWDLFYKRNKINFYKDRHWTSREFDELKAENLEYKNILEVGCGVGNFIFPLIESTKLTFAYCCDFSQRAIEFIKSNPLYDSSRMRAFQFDVTKDGLKKELEENKVHTASLIFVLSAIHPDNFSQTIKNVYECLEEGGCVVVRDYAINDHAMLRFQAGSKLSERFYVRQDNTRAYYFEMNELKNLFESKGFQTNKINYIFRETRNLKENLFIKRTFLQASFSKPLSSISS